jgi:hypothetical protein
MKPFFAENSDHNIVRSKNVSFKPHLPASPVLYGMVESGRYGRQKSFFRRGAPGARATRRSSRRRTRRHRSQRPEEPEKPSSSKSVRGQFCCKSVLYVFHMYVLCLDVWFVSTHLYDSILVVICGHSGDENLYKNVLAKMEIHKIDFWDQC